MSSPTKRFNVSAPRPYSTRDGEEKKQWINLGRATQWDDGNISIELNAVPVGNWFDGKLMLFEDDGNRQQGGQKGKQRSPQQSEPASSNGDDIDDLPF